MLTRWLLIAGIGVVMLAGITVQTLRLRNAELRVTAERERADAAAAVIEQARKDAALATRLAGEYAAEIAQLQERERDYRNAIVSAPATSACIGSPAIGALLERVRRERAATPDGRSDAAR